MEPPDLLTPSSADASVRPAGSADAAPIGAVQARAWRAAYADVIPASILDQVTGVALTPHWAAAVDAPPTRRHHVVVACAGSIVVGFAAVAPGSDRDAADGDVELVALEVDPAHQRTGHGSRLLAAVVDLARADGATVLRVWCPVVDTARHEFLVSAGLRADGARRQLEGDDGARAAQSRLSAALGT